MSYAGQLSIKVDPFTYSSEYHDNENMTLYLKARNYSAVSTRFISQDTYLYFNRYNAFGGEPVAHVDSTGHSFHSSVNHVFKVVQDGVTAVMGVYIVGKSLVTSISVKGYPTTAGVC